MVHLMKTAEEFKTKVSEPKLTVVDFYATWCGPCKVIAPKVVEFEQEFTDVNFIKVDVDELSDVAAEYSVRSMPTFLFFKNNQQIDIVVGANAAKLKETIQKHVSA